LTIKIYTEGGPLKEGSMDSDSKTGTQYLKESLTKCGLIQLVKEWESSKCLLK
jgi:hypothetical protein